MTITVEIVICILFALAVLAIAGFIGAFALIVANLAWQVIKRVQEKIKFSRDDEKEFQKDNK